MPDIPVPDLHQHAARATIAFGIPVGHVAAHHVAHDAVFGDFVGFGVHRGYGGAIADHGDGVRHAPHLVQLVADDDLRHALGFQLQHQVQQRLAVGFRQRRGRFVQDKQAHFLGQGLGDLDQLLFAHAQLVNHGAGRFGQTDLTQERLGALVGLAPVDYAANRPLVAQKQVFGNRQQRHKRQFLVDDDDPARLGFGDIGKFGQRAVIMDFAVIGSGRIHTGQYFHQGGFARAVFADKRMYLALFHRQVYSVERLDTGELLGDRAHFE